MNKRMACFKSSKYSERYNLRPAQRQRANAGEGRRSERPNDRVKKRARRSHLGDELVIGNECGQQAFTRVIQEGA